MTKRPDQHNLDQDEAGATDYKSRRRTEEQNRPGNPATESDPASRATTDTPNNQMESRRQQSEKDRQDELERAREAQERGEGHHGTGPGSAEKGDRSHLREGGGDAA